MHKLYLLAFSLFLSLVICCFGQEVRAIDKNIVISQVQIGNVSSSRLIELYNNSDLPVDITGWCVYHSSTTEKSSPDTVKCFTDTNLSLHLILRARSYLLIGSEQLGIKSDFVADSGFGLTSGGHIYIVDNFKIERDRVGWGKAEHPEGTPFIISSANLSSVIERKQENSNTYKDSDDNSIDFFDSTFRVKTDQSPGYLIGAIDDVIDVCKNMLDIQVLIPGDRYLDINNNCVPYVVDSCSNIDEIQTIIPSGYMINQSGNCVVDVCLNINGLQEILPIDKELDDTGSCINITDKCSNLLNIQANVPEKYELDDNGLCSLGLLPLKINELLPNAVGNDDGNEFIEIFNPNEIEVDLSNYIFYVGNDYSHFYSFPEGTYIEPRGYAEFSNDDINFTLLNTTSNVRLFGIDNILIDESPPYIDPKDGLAWAFIDNSWQYTNQPTPGLENLASLVETGNILGAEDQKTVASSELEPCAANQYRSPETNRCRLIVSSSSSTLTPCKDGQYRSEETNRCRSIVSDVAELVACAEGQERNPDTNRCRSVAVASSEADGLKPCAEGQERNPETNRCRNVVSVIPVVDYAPEQTSVKSDNNILWWSLVGVGFVAIIYGIWEWRQEIYRLLKKIGLFLHLTK